MTTLVYHNLPIATNEFRILSVRTAPSKTSQIVADLFVETFQYRHHYYDALSYTWGDSSSTEVIVVNGIQTPVAKNLKVALQNLRRESQSPGEPVRLWVDSICINQGNMTERNTQVAQMDKIYSQAKSVAIWLGDASETSPAAMKLLNDCHELNCDSEIIQRVISDEVGSRALTELLQRRYWKRMWVFQEIVLSQSAKVYCGHLGTAWSVLRRLDRISGDPSLWSRLAIRTGWILDLRRAFFGIAQFCMKREDAHDITNVLQPTRNLQSSDPRDKLYALLGVCNASSFPLPDYSKPARDVYVEFTRSFIDRDKDLSILLTAGPWNPENGDDIGLPSGTPDYRGMKGMDIRYLAASYLGYFNASKGRVYRKDATTDSSDPAVLSAQGVILDVVKKTVTMGTGEEKRRRAFGQIDPLSIGSNPPEESQLQAFFQAMIFDNTTLHGGSKLERPIRKENLTRLAVGFLHDLDTFNHENRNHQRTVLQDIRQLRILRSELFDTAVDEYRRLETTDPEELYWRREEYTLRTEEVTDGGLTSLFSTAKNYVGRGLITIKEDDVVAILFGSKLPVVLRKCTEQSKYQLISPCYVSGFMNGEAMESSILEDRSDENDSSRLEVERFSLV